MQTHDAAAGGAGAAATFDRQGDAEQAVYRLRLAGFRDGQLRPGGTAGDLVDGGWWLALAALGGAAGAALGYGAARLFAEWSGDVGGRDVWGLSLVCGLVAGLWGGFVGGVLGLERRGRGAGAGPLAVAVAASGAEGERARDVLRECGGHLSGPGAAG